MAAFKESWFPSFTLQGSHIISCSVLKGPTVSSKKWLIYMSWFNTDLKWENQSKADILFCTGATALDSLSVLRNSRGSSIFKNSFCFKFSFSNLLFSLHNILNILLDSRYFWRSCSMCVCLNVFSNAYLFAFALRHALFHQLGWLIFGIKFVFRPWYFFTTMDPAAICIMDTRSETALFTSLITKF